MNSRSHAGGVALLSRLSISQLKNAPFFSFYAKDWLVGTALMSPEQKGALVDLYCYAWYCDPPGTLPDDDAVLARLSGLGERWASEGAPIRAQFESVEGRLSSGDLREAFTTMVKTHENKVAAGRAGARRRWPKRDRQQGSVSDDLPRNADSEMP